MTTLLLLSGLKNFLMYLSYITSVRAAVRLKRDEYGNYKRSALILLDDLGHRVKVLIGDLFSYQNSLVGYWSFVTNLAKWKFVSSRSLSVIDLQCLANTFDKI